MARGGRRRRRLGSAGHEGPAAGAAVLAWAELRDLAADYGVAPRTSETPRHFSERLRSPAALGEPDGTGAPGHRAVASLTEDFERQEYGRPAAVPGPAAGAAMRVPACAVRVAAPPGPPPPGWPWCRPRCAANAKPWARFRAAWLPASVLSAWRRAAGSAVRAVSDSEAHPARRRGFLVEDPRRRPPGAPELAGPGGPKVSRRPAGSGS